MGIIGAMKVEEYLKNEEFKNKGNRSDDFDTSFANKEWAEEESSSFSVSNMIFSGCDEPKAGSKLSLEVKIRYQAPLAKCDVEYLGNGKALVHLLRPARSVTSGQSAVFYSENRLLFGGFID